MDNNLIYDSSSDNNIQIVLTKRANAPERGCVFTAKAINESGKEDLIIDRIKFHTGYIKRNFSNPIEVIPGESYRFKIVAGPYQRKFHNFYYAIPLRRLKPEESDKLNLVDPQTSLLIQRLGEFLLGIGWNRHLKKNYRLNKKQRTWDWFYDNFM